MDFHRGTLCPRGHGGDHPDVRGTGCVIEFFGDEIEQIHTLHPPTGDDPRGRGDVRLLPATTWRTRMHEPGHHRHRDELRG
ncbi:hypothetical protein [Arthrobacter sp.]|uniref:hypothetical protein n=1 Tax=Arthrobacter sp. TaxID=1667 RepID=UPI003A959553